MLDSLHDLPEEFIVDIYSPSLYDLLDPALAGETLIGLGIGTNHLQQLLCSNQIVQNYDLFGELRNVLFRIGHACHFALQQLVHYYDQSVGGLKGNAKSVCTTLLPIGVKVGFVTVTIFLGNFDELVTI